MKKIISLVTLMALAFPASAEDVDVSFSGDFRLRGQHEMVQGFDAVSYTHLTLPTICSV